MTASLAKQTPVPSWSVADRPCFALVNVHRSPMAQEWLKTVNAEYYYLYDKPPPSSLTGLLPLLINLDGTDCAAIVGDLAEQESIILITPAAGADAAAVTKHLCRFRHVRLPDGRTVWFRFYEPYVFTAFLHFCDDEVRSLIFGDKISRIVVPDVYSGSSELYLPPGEIQKVQPVRPLPLPAGLFEKILDAQHEQLVRKAVRLMQTHEQCSKLTRELLYGHVAELFESAMDCGITKYEYFIDLAGFSVMNGLDWHKSAQAKAVFSGPADQDEKMRELDELFRALPPAKGS